MITVTSTLHTSGIPGSCAPQSWQRQALADLALVTVPKLEEVMWCRARPS